MDCRVKPGNDGVRLAVIQKPAPSPGRVGASVYALSTAITTATMIIRVRGVRIG